MSAQTSYLTISVDDAHPKDLKTAELLSKAGLKATFYIPVKTEEGALLTPPQIRELGNTFELGGHTYNHVELDRLEPEAAYEEVLQGKRWLEDLWGQAPTAFCYPMGKYSRGAREAVRRAGFLGGRTCRYNVSSWPSDPFAWDISTHACSHSPAIQVRHALKEANFRGALDFFRVHHAARDWEEHFTRSLEWVATHGGIAHLFVHSWEIDQHGHWQKLERVLTRAASYRNLKRVTNGELFALWPGHAQAGPA